MNLDLFVIPYSFKSMNLNQEEILKLAAQIGFDGVEGGTLTDEYLELLAKYGLKCCNCELVREDDGTVSEDYLKRLEQYNVSGIVSVRTGDMAAFFKEMMDRSRGYRGIPGAFGTFADAVAAAEKANEAARIAAQYGFKTMYHNHTHEWRMDAAHGEYIMDTYLRHSDENHVMEFDVGWALTAGIDPIYWMKRWPGRIGCLHIKSCNWALGPESLGMSCPVPKPEIGLTPDQQAMQQAYAEGPQGPMEKSICDWSEVIRTSLDAGCKTFIIERERIYEGDILNCLQADHDHIRKCMAAL